MNQKEKNRNEKEELKNSDSTKKTGLFLFIYNFF